MIEPARFGSGASLAEAGLSVSGTLFRQQVVDALSGEWLGSIIGGRTPVALAVDRPGAGACGKSRAVPVIQEKEGAEGINLA